MEKHNIEWKETSLNPDFLSIISEQGRIRLNYAISNISWFKTGGRVDLLFIPKDEEGLRLFFLKAREFYPDKGIFIMGAGSNIVIPDEGYGDFIVRLGRGFNYLEQSGDASILAGAGVLDISLAKFAKEKGIGGLEFFYGIPGTVGGALAMNAGCYGSDTSNVLKLAKAMHSETGEIRKFSLEEIGYSYRSKRLPNKWVFLEGEYEGYIKDKNKIEEEMHNIHEARKMSQPLYAKTGGSTFKNPQGGKIKAWELIDKAGCRGMQIGGARISELHANFIINDGAATSNDIKSLISKVQKIVWKDSKIMLEPEVIIL